MRRPFSPPREFHSITAIKIIWKVNKNSFELSRAATGRFCTTLADNNQHNNAEYSLKDIPLFWPKHWHWAIVATIVAYLPTFGLLL